LVCVGLGWKDQALTFLSRACEERSGWIAYLRVDPRLDLLRGDVRFVDLLRRVHLSPQPAFWGSDAPKRPVE
jgi:hypothetical protein